MLNYKIAYHLRMGSFFAEVLDFPEVTAFGPTVAAAREAVLYALRYAAQRLLRRGELLPVPDAGRAAPDAYLVEVVSLLPSPDEGVWVQTVSA
jgi:predicted RNase H-like HicB family nuclease